MRLNLTHVHQLQEQMVTMAPLIVMLSGWAGSGKDVAASILVKEYGFRRIAFADALKVDAAKRSGVPLHTFHSAAKDEPLQTPCSAFLSAKTPRDILLQLALQVRATNPDIYADSIICDIIESTREDQFVVSDWRYRREATRIQEMLPSARLLRVRIHRHVTQSSDPSEHDLDNEPMDIIIENNTTIAALEKCVHTIFTPYLESQSVS